MLGIQSERVYLIIHEVTTINCSLLDLEKPQCSVGCGPILHVLLTVYRPGKVFFTLVILYTVGCMELGSRERWLRA